MLCGSDQFDSHDEKDDEGEGESVEEHKSVIMHLLSQVRLGMDLTKVTLFCSPLCPLPLFVLSHCFHSFPGGFTHIHLGEEVVIGNVCRFLCTP